jgi:endoglucanase
MEEEAMTPSPRLAWAVGVIAVCAAVAGPASVSASAAPPDAAATPFQEHGRA